MKFRKILSAAAAVCMLAGSCITQSAVQALTPPPYGDVNLDFSVDVADAVLIARYCVMDTEAVIRDEGKIWGDVNLDGNLDQTDMTQILEYIAHKRTHLGEKEQPIQPKAQAVSLMQDIETQAVEGKDADEAFLSSQMKLAVDLFRGAMKDSQSADKNLLISPLSVSQALAMTANGAKGNTRAEMEKLLGDTLSIDALNQYYYSCTNKLTDTDKPSLHLANALWICDDETMIQVPEAFLQTANDYFHADAFKAPFDQSTVSDINNWVSDQTEEMIPKLVDKLDANTVMMLVNALAFDGEWETPFTTFEAEVPILFHAYDGDMNADMMTGTAPIYLTDGNATGFIKEYSGGQYSFAAILPKESVSVTDYIGNMTAESLQKLLDNRIYIKVDATMPKFSYAYELKMNDMLKALDMKDAFDPSLADFTGLNTLGATSIDTVLHKTFIQVDEKGTKAAAVTGVSMYTQSVERSYSLTLDRPFIYMILDNNTNLPVFMGYVLHPAADAE